MIKVSDNLILPQSDKEAETPLDLLFAQVSSFVCEHGPQLLTLGMSQLEANTALLACLRELLSRAQVAERNAKDDNEQKADLLRQLQRANDVIDAVKAGERAFGFLEYDWLPVKKALEAFDARM